MSLWRGAGKGFARVILKNVQTEASRQSVPWKPMLNSFKEIYNLHDILSSSTAEEKSWATKAALNRLCWSNQGFWHSEQVRMEQSAGSHWLSSILIKVHIVFSRWDANHCSVQRFPIGSFAKRSGVKQGCVISPTLIRIYFAVLFQVAFKNTPGDVFFHCRADGPLFNLLTLRDKTQVTIRDLLFADDAALVRHSSDTLKMMINRLHETCKAFVLIIRVRKTVILTQGVPTTTADVKLDGKPLKVVQTFRYLGSTVSSTVSIAIWQRDHGKTSTSRWTLKSKFIKHMCSAHYSIP